MSPRATFDDGRTTGLVPHGGVRMNWREIDEGGRCVGGRADGWEFSEPGIASRGVNPWRVEAEAEEGARGAGEGRGGGGRHQPSGVRRGEVAAARARERRRAGRPERDWRRHARVRGREGEWWEGERWGDRDGAEGRLEVRGADGDFDVVPFESTFSRDVSFGGRLPRRVSRRGRGRRSVLSWWRMPTVGVIWWM